MKQIITLALLFVCFTAHSQMMGYRQGLIITQSDDTIMCLVPIGSSFGNKVSIKRSEESKAEEIPLSDIKFLATETNVYEHVVYMNKDKEIHKLMWRQLEGDLVLYQELDMKVSRTDLTHGGSATYFSPPTKTYVIRKGDSTYLVEGKNFIETIKPLIATNTELVKKVEKKRYKLDNIEKLVEEFNSKALQQ